MSFNLSDASRIQRIEFQKEIVRAYIWQSCLNCSHFLENEDCELFKARPPAHIIVNGCKDHDFDCPF